MGRAATGVGKFLLGSKAQKNFCVWPPVRFLPLAHKSPAEKNDLTPVEISVGQIVYAADFSPESSPQPLLRPPWHRNLDPG